MKLRKKFVIMTIVVFVVSIFFSVYASKLTISVYVDNRKVPARAIESGGEIYISLSDLAKYFPGQMSLDTKAGRIDIISNPVTIKPAPMTGDSKLPDRGIIGNISFKANDGKDFVVQNIKIILYLYNPDLPDEVSNAQLKRFAEGKDNEYIGTHGSVRETFSDDNGNFYIAGVAAGKYELTAIYIEPGGKKGIYWRSVINVEKDTLTRANLNSANANTF